MTVQGPYFGERNEFENTKQKNLWIRAVQTGSTSTLNRLRIYF